MTNYYYKTNTTLSSIIKGTTDSNIQAAYGGTGGLTIATSTFTSVVTETPSILNYSYQGTDISISCIAYWVEGSSGTPTTPTWCTKIRAVLVGGGGAGANGLAGTNYPEVHEHYAYGVGIFDAGGSTRNQAVDPNQQIHGEQQENHENYNYGFHRNVAWQTNTTHIDTAAYQVSGLGGGGGGGGGFLYLGETSIGGNTPTISFTPVALKGKTTTLTIGSSTWAALGGTNASGVTLGTGGSTSGTANKKMDGENGTTATTPAAGSGGKCFLKDYASSLTYGKGGDGSNGVGGGGTPSNAQSGQAEYYRIYFLTG